MIGIPFRTPGASTYALVLVMEDSSMERLKVHDPAMLDVYKMGEPWASLQLISITIAYESAEDCAKISNWVRENQIGRVMKHITRGFKYRPELGDDDAQYLNMSGKPS